MSNNIYYNQLLPEKVLNELDDICQVIADNICLKKFNPDYLCEVVSIIAYNTRKDNEPTPLRINYIKKLVPQGDKYLKALIDLGIIERSGNYIPNQTSYKYEFSKDYYSKYVPRPLNDAKLKKRINETWEGIRKDQGKTTRGKSEQVRFLKRLEIDEAWKEYVSTITDIDKFNSVMASATKIENGDIFYSVDDTSGRFHSNVTNMKKELRQYLRVDGERLINIDIKNCQPYLSTMILTNPEKASKHINNHAFSMLLRSLEKSHRKDVIKYISLVVYGRIYEYLMPLFNMTRDETKVQVLKVLFARNRAPKNETDKRCRAIFREHFPTVHRIFSKVRGYEQGDKFTSYKRFAILLQRIEAYIMLELILKRIRKELPDAVAITIHDSVMTGLMTDRVNEVAKIMSEEIQKYIGFQPQINIEGLYEGKKGEGRKLAIYKQYDAENVCNVDRMRN